jgi:hypothetical protein
MSTGPGLTSTASQFDRTLSLHLATCIIAGIECDPLIVRQCFDQTLEELRMAPHPAYAARADEIGACFVHNVVTLMQPHQRFIATMPVRVDSIFIAELLSEKPW